MFYDYHMHCSFSDDSTTPMEDMIKQSIKLGLKEICFTDHVDYDLYHEPHDIGIDYDKYFLEIDKFAKLYKDQISIKKGIEMGVQTQILDKCSKDIKEHDFDFVIASTHTINKLDLYIGDYQKGKTQHEVYEGYYKNLLEIVNSFNDYSILGHLDLIKRYSKKPSILPDNLFYEYIEAILKKVISDEKGIELNTSCFRYNLPDLTPSLDILRLYKKLGGQIITVGSDSHNPEQVAKNFELVHNLLREIGYKYVCKFSKMKPEFIKL